MNAYLVARAFGYEGYQAVAVRASRDDAEHHRAALQKAFRFRDRDAFRVYAIPSEPDWHAAGYDADTFGVPAGPLT